MESPENSSQHETESSHEEKTPTTTKKKTKNHPRRFTDDQIKSLETIFKLETKLEPRKKLQIARDVGLQPRQVAIWFQNKRARWKSKQIEQEYRLLRSNYDTLSMQFEDLKREKRSLQMQLQQLSDLVKNHEKINLNDRHNSSSEGMDHNEVMINRDDEKIIDKYLDKTDQDQELISWGEEEEEINQTWRNLSSSDGLFDQSSGNSNWWES